ncbi:zinc-dependent metalloprotease, partial [Pseudonocardia pini]|uniref:zinc-dependent metalloprotease n=1 Tax=Pseudonocardia pini TaxID=2758030 RepID=UPI0015F06835
LEMRPRKLRAAAELWKLLAEERGIDGRDALWAHPDLLPDSEDLDDPAGFVNRRELADPIAELEKQFAAEEAEKAQQAEKSEAGSTEPEAGSAETDGEAEGPKDEPK